MRVFTVVDCKLLYSTFSFPASATAFVFQKDPSYTEQIQPEFKKNTTYSVSMNNLATHVNVIQKHIHVYSSTSILRHGSILGLDPLRR